MGFWAWDDDIISDLVKEIGQFFSIFQNLFLINTRAKDTIGGLVFLRLNNNSMSLTFFNNNIAKSFPTNLRKSYLRSAVEFYYSFVCVTRGLRWL